MSDKKAMNLLFITSDEHNKRMMGCSGHPQVKTPWIDSLARDGARFENAYCNSPICLPSRASFTTGDYPSRHGYWDNAFPYGGEVKGFGHRLSEAGIPVVTIGKLHYKDDNPETGFPDQRIPLNAQGGIGDVFGCVRSVENNRPELGQLVTKAYWGDSPYIRYNRGIADEAVRFLNEESQSHDAPWFLNVGFVLPHPPFAAPEEYQNMYKPEDVVFPKNYWSDDRPRHPVIDEIRRYMDIEGEFTEEQVRKAVAIYYGMCTELDRQMGRILLALKENGLDENTRIIYVSDHGDMVGAQGLWLKHILYEESVSVPFLISGPDIPENQVIRENVSLIDLYPTILDCFGLEPTGKEKELPGQSLLPVVRKEEKLDKNRIIYSEYFAIGSITGMYMIRKNNYKLCYYAYYPCQLFDLENDPEETLDLAGDPKYNSVIEELEKELRKIVDPERLSLQSRIDQLEKMEQFGGYRKVLTNGPQFTTSPVPAQFI